MRAILAAAAVLALSAAVPAQAQAFKKGPYLQHVTRTGITVMWEVDAPAPGRVIVRSPVEPDHVVEAPPARLHEVRIEGLEPGRRYTYTVECAGQRSGGEIATAPADPGEPFSFVVFGDSRSNHDAHRVIVERVRREVPDFILGTGDMVNEGSNENDWQSFFTIERDLLRDNVLFPSLGNHDRDSRPQRTAEHYRRYFSLPADSPDPERYYAFTYGNSRFLVLDSNSSSFALTDQTAWLERQLEQAVADPAIRHIFVAMHHPPYSTSLHGGQSELREMWSPLFVRYGVDAVFSGHDHTYERSEMDGVRYFVSGGGGAPLYPRDPRPAPEDARASIYFERTFNYLRVQVVGDFVEVAAMRDDGTLIENLSWGRLPEPPEPEPAGAIVARPAPPPRVAVGATPGAASAPAGKACGCSVGRARGAGAASVPLALASTLLLVLACRRRRPPSCKRS